MGVAPPHLRSLRVAGLALTVLVALPAAFQAHPERPRLFAWGALLVVFALCFFFSVASRTRALRVGLLGAQVACVALSVLAMCHGFEGSLLVLVAFQIGEIRGLRIGVALVTLATALLATAIGVHWAPGAALLLAPPYLGLSLLALAVSRLLQEQLRKNAELAFARAAVEENGRLAERVRIARDLHDTVGHRMTALRLHLEAATRTTGTDRDEACRTAHALAGDVLSDIRETVADLREDDAVDLVTALRAMTEDLPSPPRVHLALQEPFACPDGAPALTLLRCAQELVTNAAKHARAENLWIEITEADGVIVVDARDDGSGDERVTMGAGLRGMRERVEAIGGELDVTTARGAGFRVRARLPTGAR